MRVRFKGEADGLPCEVFGMVFPAGEWTLVDGIALKKLVGNPMFDADEAAKKAAFAAFDHDGDGYPGGSPKGGLRKAPEPEPDPEADEDPPAPVVVLPVAPPADDGPSLDELRATLTERGIKFHHKAGRDKLLALI